MQKRIHTIMTTLLMSIGILILLVGNVTGGTEQGGTIIIRMMDIQDKWFRSEIIREFEKQFNVQVNVATFDKEWDLEKMLALEKQAGQKRTTLVKTPLDMTRVLQAKGLLIPYDQIVDVETLQKVAQEYVDLAWQMGVIDGKTYFIPRKLETRVMVYVKPRVAEAVEKWETFRSEIDALLRQENGYGLPAGYTLEADPNQWDYYDLFVVAYYWSRTPYFGIKLARMAHRGQKYGGTVQGLVDRIFQMGGTQEDVLKMNTPPVIDMFHWEALYRKHGLYNEGMWQDPWTGGGIWNAMKDGKVFLAWMHQIDSFFIHGGSNPQMQGFLANPDDLGLAVMPLGISVELTAEGKPVRTGSRKAGTTGWWWGVPTTTPDPQISWKLARFITNHENHLAEARIFGMMPIRRDIVDNLNDAFPEKWMQEIFDISMKQLQINGETTAPLIPQYAEVGKNYLEAWYDIVVDQNYGRGERVDPAYIKNRLDRIYVRKQRAVLGEAYPR